MKTRVDDILRRNSLSVTESRKKILSLFLTYMEHWPMVILKERLVKSLIG